METSSKLSYMKLELWQFVLLCTEERSIQRAPFILSTQDNMWGLARLL
jgi:hypothetical protein